jgi:uncharacterized protein YyaL (SSP411 family)
MKSNSKPNALIHEASPYLLQHAYNPVYWLPWSAEALQKAERENKLVLVSIGYSACHWCHVMERECFEDVETADIMNMHFVCIKIDREERPDIDQLYLSSAHLMGQRGGWPLNCIALPDGRAVYGGTYFPRLKWQQVLLEIARIYKESKGELLDYAERLANGLRQTELFKIDSEKTAVEMTDLEASVEAWKQEFDREFGGPNRAPKFPLPSNYRFLLRYGYLCEKDEIIENVKLTLNTMAAGGIYDQIGGGFARYSTDVWWKVPHFEKMLYDNAQLISLYAEASLAFKNERYSEICKQTIAWAQRELSNGEGAYYSALDADSEGEEGKFYVWNEHELRQILTEEELEVFNHRYHWNEQSHWEEGHGHILVAKGNAASNDAVLSINQKMLEYRNQRVRPGLDDKIILSWNAMMAAALADAARYTGEMDYLEMARKTLRFIEKNMIESGSQLFRIWKNGKRTVDGFLEDYVWLTRAYLAIYLAGYSKHDLDRAQQVHHAASELFQEAGEGLLYFTQERQDATVVRQLETNDNVIPSSNALFAENAYLLGRISGNEDWKERGMQMLRAVRRDIRGYGPGASQWMQLALESLKGINELVIVGNGAVESANRLRQTYRPGILLLASNDTIDFGLFKGREAQNQPVFYCCEAGNCSLPETNEAIVVEKLDVKPA